MALFNSVNFFWIISSAALTFLSHYFFSRGPDYIGGYSYPAFYFVYIVLVLFARGLDLKLNSKLHWSVFIVGTIMLMTGEPLFENDHYRYLWEGKVFLSGENPYAFAPDSQGLEDIEFKYKNYIGFPYLSSIYPPLSLVWFGFVSFLPYALGLRILMALNAYLVYVLLDIVEPKRKWHLLLVFPLLQKEFIQAVHIDLFAFLLFFYILQKTKRLNFQTGGIAFSFWTKILAILALPFVLLQERKLKFFKLFSLIYIPISLVFFFYIMIFFLPGGDLFSGVKAFSGQWEWNSGLYSIFKRLGRMDGLYARKATLIIFVISYFILLWKYFKQKIDLVPALLLVYSSLMFCSPVYNGWYSIWFLPFALQLGSLPGILYACASSIGYIAWGYYDFTILRLGEAGTHIFFFALLLEAYIKKGFTGHEEVDAN